MYTFTTHVPCTCMYKKDVRGNLPTIDQLRLVEFLNLAHQNDNHSRPRTYITLLPPPLSLSLSLSPHHTWWLLGHRATMACPQHWLCCHWSNKPNISGWPRFDHIRSREAWTMAKTAAGYVHRVYYYRDSGDNLLQIKTIRNTDETKTKATKRTGLDLTLYTIKGSHPSKAKSIQRGGKQSSPTITFPNSSSPILALPC